MPCRELGKRPRKVPPRNQPAHLPCMMSCMTHAQKTVVFLALFVWLFNGHPYALPKQKSVVHIGSPEPFQAPESLSHQGSKSLVHFKSIRLRSQRGRHTEPLWFSLLSENVAHLLKSPKPPHGDTSGRRQGASWGSGILGAAPSRKRRIVDHHW